MRDVISCTIGFTWDFAHLAYLCRIFSDLNKAPCSISIMWPVIASITGQITEFSTYQRALVNKIFTYVAKGGKTATADNPNGTRAKDKARV